MSKSNRYDEQRQRTLGVALFVIGSLIGVGILITLTTLAIQVLTA